MQTSLVPSFTWVALELYSFLQRVSSDRIHIPFDAIYDNTKRSLSSKLISLCNNVLFIFEWFHYQQDFSLMESIISQNRWNVSSSSSDRLAQYCLNLSRWFSHETAAFCTGQCISPLLFHKYQVISWSALRTLWTMALFGTPFCYLYACAQNSHAALNSL